MAAAIFSEILAKGVRSGQIPARTKESRQWYRDTARSTTAVTPSKLYRQSADAYVGRITVGRLYCFFYDAKTKDKLPYWDRFPMVFPFAEAEGGFLGINLHYLPPPLRAALMDELYSLANNARYDESTKLRLSYEALGQASKHKLFKPCIHRYLLNHVKSKFVMIDPVDWETAVFLPVESFTKARKTSVWKQSKQKLGM